MDDSMTKFVVGYNPVNDRTIKIGLQGQPLNLTLIQVYAPTSTVSEDTIEIFYNQRQDVLDNVLNIKHDHDCGRFQCKS